MAHKCFISFKTEDMDYKKKIQEDMDIDMIDKSLDEPINSDDEDYIMRKIREDYLADSTVTIYLIGEYSAENSFVIHFYARYMEQHISIKIEYLIEKECLR